LRLFSYNCPSPISPKNPGTAESRSFLTEEGRLSLEPSAEPTPSDPVPKFGMGLGKFPTAETASRMGVLVETASAFGVCVNVNELNDGGHSIGLTELIRSWLLYRLEDLDTLPPKLLTLKIWFGRSNVCLLTGSERVRSYRIPLVLRAISNIVE
jgi:hypothetical protein